MKLSSKKRKKLDQTLSQPPLSNNTSDLSSKKDTKKLRGVAMAAIELTHFTVTWMTFSSQNSISIKMRSASSPTATETTLTKLKKITIIQNRRCETYQ